MLKDIWERQSQWSQAADSLKSRVGAANDLILAGTVLGAILSTLSAAVGVEKPAGQVLIYAAAAVAATVAIATAFAGKDGLDPWTRARSVAEAIKSEVYLYLPRAGEYAKGDAGERLVGQVERFEADAADEYEIAMKLEPKRRDLPEVTDAATYANVRVKPQIEGYYLRRAGELRTQITAARVLQAVLGAGGAALAVIAAGTDDNGWAVWVPVVTTASTAVAAHVAAERWKFLRQEFSRTALQLRHLVSAYERGKLAPGEFVVQCETVISLQNAAWMAKLAEPPQ